MSQVSTIKVSEIAKNIDNGELRLINTEFSLHDSWFPDSSIGFGEILLSNYGVSEGDTEIQKQFFKEVKAIRKWIDENDTSTYRSPIDSGMIRQSLAFEIWDDYAVPLRWKGESIYRIWPPQDVMGSPTIKSVSIDEFLAFIALKSVHVEAKIESLNNQLSKWRNGAVILAIVLAIWILFSM